MGLKKYIKKASKFFKLLRVKDFRNGLAIGVAATTEHIDVLKSIKGLDVLIDIGANKGQFSLAFKNIYPRSTIYAFEPLKEPSRILKKLFKEDNSVIVYDYAIGSRKGKDMMNVSKRADSSSLLSIGQNQVNNFPGTEFESHEAVITLPLHHTISEEKLKGKTLVKIDVQGFELEVLKGSQEVIKFFDYLYIECSFIELYEKQPLAHEVIKYLQNNGFILNGVYNNFCDNKGIVIQADLLFKKLM